MDYKQAMKSIDEQKFAPVYVAYGSESYLIEQFIRKLTDKMIEPEHLDFAVSKYDLNEVPVQNVIADAETLPFMVPRKLIIAGNAQFLTGSRDSGKVDHQLDRLTEYLGAPVDFTVLVFTVSVDKLDERKKLVKQLKDKKALVPCLPLTAEELQAWVRRQAKRESFELADGVVDQLVLYTGGHLQSLAAEIEKISLNVGRGGTATPELIDSLVVRSTEQNVFILIEQVVQLRLDRAFALLEELLKQKEEPIKIVMLMARQFRIMLQVKELSKQSYSQQQIAGQLGLHPYAVKVAEGQARAYDIEKLSRIVSQLADLDFKMKSGGIDKVLGLELFLLGLAA
ncbi:DNA polymerase III subunit delta [Paenibacillus chitinolyticus]|uniref:DNA polymerase III subunit delta n=1 Tax=Paenibacillus chitinolyticus TaxID=79263 RepID=UPI002DBF5DA8|nr:DNA polymerase III subunit delta [Paenibacillus chitinolyticus]MEC0249241.1 DNA polymerase III subunit delta [Paenibacillus chitinolyticus]